MFYAICKFTQFWNCAAQIRNCEIANQFWNCATTFANSWNWHCYAWHYTHHQPVYWLEGKAHPLGRGEDNWWAEIDAFSPRTWTVVHARSSVPYLSRSFCLFGRFNWHSVLCRTLQNAVADNWCLCLLHSSSINLVSPPSIPKFSNCTAQFRNRIPVSKLVCNFTTSNLRSAVSKLRKFANCAEHIHQTKVGMQKYTALDVSNLFHSFLHS